MSDLQVNQASTNARAAILRSIRGRLAESAPHDRVMAEGEPTPGAIPTGGGVEENGQHTGSLVVMFRERLESVGGHCLVVRGEGEAVRALGRILAELQGTSLRARRIALSDAPLVERLMREAEVDVDVVTISPSAADLFGYDVGVTAAQAAIAETGTLVLESESERHRLVSLLPPVHIAVVNAADICMTLGEALRRVRQSTPMSRTITFITGPSRTADIELTLAIGVHGPKELYVIVDEGPPSE
jgi:L-lactate dehydrogenase complex protein LldG